MRDDYLFGEQMVETRCASASFRQVFSNEQFPLLWLQHHAEASFFSQLLSLVEMALMAGTAMVSSRVERQMPAWSPKELTFARWKNHLTEKGWAESGSCLWTFSAARLPIRVEMAQIRSIEQRVV